MEVVGIVILITKENVMKSKVITLLILTILGSPSMHAVTKAQAAGAAVSKGEEKSFARLFDAIENANMDEVEMLLQEDTQLSSLVETHRHKGLTAIEKVDQELMKNKNSSLTRGSKAAVTRKLHKIKARLEGQDGMSDKPASSRKSKSKSAQ